MLAVLFSHCAVVPTGSKQSLRYEQFTDLADFLRYQPGIKVTGTGMQTDVRFRRSPDHAPLYFLNGLAMGSDYRRINEIIHMVQVKDVRISNGLASRTSTGVGSKGGMIEVWTW